MWVCGTRFLLTINNEVPVPSKHTGIDVDEEIIDFLQTAASPVDARFHYAHWPVRNALTTQQARRCHCKTHLPVAGSFDVIWLFSVFTHLDPDDAAAMLRILRQHRLSRKN
ncbi:MAG: class I SAM-dependent methyltransferase [Cellvibrionales bacterium]|nr:class I SAM-dependent methyltransferase [Cellvibrionales bacterium]